MSPARTHEQHRILPAQIGPYVTSLILRCVTGAPIWLHAWSDLVETMGIEPTTPCLQIRKMAMPTSSGSYRIVSDCAI